MDGLRTRRTLLIISSFFLCLSCGPKKVSRDFDGGEYQVIHGEPHLCIQKDMTEPWKETCKNIKSGEIVTVEKIQLTPRQSNP